MKQVHHVDAVRAQAIRLGMPPGAALLLVETANQRLLAHVDAGTPGIYPVSTSRFGLNEREGSFGTPRGFHAICERYGERLPPGAVLSSRVFTGEVLPRAEWSSGSGDDRILSRILRLAGMEPGINQGGAVDTYARMIYLHGTNQEHLVGKTPASHGCIRLRNDDIIALFERLSGRDAWCWIA